MEKMDLLENIDKIHTTELGLKRIRQNLGLKTDDVVLWCKNAVKNADLLTLRGKNWYAYCGENVITVNAKSFTVITAHKLKETGCNNTQAKRL